MHYDTKHFTLPIFIFPLKYWNLSPELSDVFHYKYVVVLKGLSFGGQQNLLVLESRLEPTFQRHHFLNLTLLLTSEPMLLEKLTVLCERSWAETRNFLSNGSGVYSSAALRLFLSFSLDRWFFDTPDRILHIHVDAFGLLVDIFTFTHANSLSTVCSFRIFPFERRFRRSVGLFHWLVFFCDLIFSTHTWHFLEVFTVGWRHAGNKVSFKHASMSVHNVQVLTQRRNTSDWKLFFNWH